MKFHIFNHSKPVDTKKVDIFFSLLFLFATGLTVWGIHIYQLTIIDTKYVVAAAAIGTIIAFTATLLLKVPYSILWNLIQSIAIGSGIFHFAFLCLNQVFADKRTINEDFQIIETGVLARSGKSKLIHPYAIIDFKGQRKQLVFNSDVEQTIKNYSKVSLTLSKGLFGFDVIKAKQLTD